jgi:hypothetical protein
MISLLFYCTAEPTPLMLKYYVYTKRMMGWEFREFHHSPVNLMHLY